MKINKTDIKNALKSTAFTDKLPNELRTELESFLSNPECNCHNKFISKIAKNFKKELLEYYPDRKEIFDEEQEKKELMNNRWKVINCHISELEGHLRALGGGRKQIEVARFNDQVTVVINELDILY